MSCLIPNRVLTVLVTLRALSSRTGAIRTNVLTYMNGPVFRALQDAFFEEGKHKHLDEIGWFGRDDP